MKLASLLAAAAVILLSNAFALVHAWRNRSGPADSDIVLTQRELPKSFADTEDSGVALDLRWTDPRWPLFMVNSPQPWLDQKVLQELGFDTSVAPSDKTASEFYSRQRARRTYIALEFDGPAWRAWLEEVERQAQAQAQPPNIRLGQREVSTRLVAMDASTDAARLRARHPDRSSVLVVPGLVRIGVDLGPNAPPRLSGWVQEIPSSIHVPLPFSDAFRRPPGNAYGAKYQVHLRYGSSLEPWIIGVEFPPPAAP